MADEQNQAQLMVAAYPTGARVLDLRIYGRLP